MHEPTLLCQLTAPGRGAIAVLGLRGAGAQALLQRYFTPHSAAAAEDPSPWPAGILRYGHWGGTVPGESVVVTAVDPQRLEVACHGGPAVTAALWDDLVAAGAEPVDSRAWCRRAEGDPPAVAAARRRLGEAATPRTAAILLDQCRGALLRAAESARATAAKGNLDEARALLSRVLERAEIGRHLVAPWQIVLAGPPNVGKSSLMNALLGYRRSVIFDAPGTTRDVVTAETALGGWPVRLADTAGLRASDDDVERQGVDRSMAQVRSADLVVLVAEADAPWSVYHHRAAATARRRLWVRNKIDRLPSPQRPSYRALGRDPEHPLGTIARPEALAGDTESLDGIEWLAERIVATLVPEPLEPGHAVPLDDEQVAVLHAALEAADAKRLAESLEPLWRD